MAADTGYQRARAAGLRLRVDYDAGRWQLHNGASVLALIDRTRDFAYSVTVTAAHVAADAPAIARVPGGMAYMGRSATLRGAVDLALRGLGR